MMLLLPLLLAAAPVNPLAGLPIGELAKQDLPIKGCAAYFFTAGDTHVFVAMALPDPAMLRLVVDGTTVDLARASQGGDAGFGFPGTAEYRGDALAATLDMTVTTRSDLRDGAAIPQATLRIDRTGKDSVILPLAGIIGCA